MKNMIGWILIASAIIFYAYGVIEAIQISWEDKVQTKELEIQQGLDTGTAAIGALLLANFGAALGISITNQNTALSGRMFPNARKANSDIPPPATARENIQSAAVLIYLISLIACFITWIHNDFSSDPKQVLPFISQSAKMFLGVLTAYLASILGRQS